jgi:hypothetical protein
MQTSEIEYLVIGSTGAVLGEFGAGDRSVAIISAQAIGGRVEKTTILKREVIFDASERLGFVA